MHHYLSTGLYIMQYYDTVMRSLLLQPVATLSCLRALLTHLMGCGWFGSHSYCKVRKMATQAQQFITCLIISNITICIHKYLQIEEYPYEHDRRTIIVPDNFWNVQCPYNLRIKSYNCYLSLVHVCSNWMLCSFYCFDFVH